jgi:hypothetical protein
MLLWPKFLMAMTLEKFWKISLTPIKFRFLPLKTSLESMFRT